MGHIKFININICQNQIFYKIIKIIYSKKNKGVTYILMIQIPGFGSHFQLSNVKNPTLNTFILVTRLVSNLLAQRLPSYFTYVHPLLQVLI